MEICPECKVQLPDYVDSYCPKCGADLAESEALFHERTRQEAEDKLLMSERKQLRIEKKRLEQESLKPHPNQCPREQCGRALEWIGGWHCGWLCANCGHVFVKCPKCHRAAIIKRRLIGSDSWHCSNRECSKFLATSLLPRKRGMVHWIRILTAVFAVLCAAFTSGLLAFLVLTKIFMGGWKTLVAELLGWEFIALVYAYLGVPCAALGLLLHYVDRNRSAILNRVLLWSIGLLVVPVLMFVVGQLLVAVLTSRPPANF